MSHRSVWQSQPPSMAEQSAQDEYMGRVRGNVLPHQSNFHRSAHSREGYYPTDTIDVHRYQQSGYAENLDQPSHAGAHNPHSDEMKQQLQWEQQQIQLAQSQPSYASPRRKFTETPVQTQQRTAKKNIDQFRLTRLFPVLRFKKPHEQLPGVIVIKKPKRAKNRSPSPHQLSSRHPKPSMAVQPHSNETSQAEFDPSSPMVNFHQMRAQTAGAGGNPNSSRPQIMSTLTPRTHSRAIIDFQNQQEQQGGGYPPAFPASPRGTYHPTAGGRPGTSPLVGSTVQHNKPFMPCNPTEARDTVGSKMKGPFLYQNAKYQDPLVLQFRDNSPPPPHSQRALMMSSNPSHREQSLVVSARQQNRNDTLSSRPSTTEMKTQSPPMSPRPFCSSVSRQQAESLTRVDYYLNSPDMHVKRLEKIWVAEQARNNKADFLRELRSRQESERAAQRERDIKEGRTLSNEPLPPRPLAILDSWNDMYRNRHGGLTHH